MHAPDEEKSDDSKDSFCEELSGCNDNGIRIVCCATSKNLVVKSTIFVH